MRELGLLYLSTVRTNYYTLTGDQRVPMIDDNVATPTVCVTSRVWTATSDCGGTVA